MYHHLRQLQQANWETDISIMSIHHFIIGVDSLKHHSSQDTELFHHHQDLPNPTH